MPSTTLPVAATGLPSSRRSLIRGLAAIPLVTLPALAVSCAPVATPAQAATHPDAPLLALGAEADDIEKQIAALSAAFQEGDEESGFEIDDRSMELAAVHRQIAAEPAATMEGLVVKAKALRSIYADDGLSLDTLFGRNQRTTDRHLLLAIVNNLLAIGGAA